METSDWRVFTCPKCGGLVKTARNVKAARVACPSCRHSIELAPPSSDAAEPSQNKVPVARSFNPNPNKLRGEAKESWEAKTPELRQIDFKEKLGKTIDHIIPVDPNAAPKRRLKVFHRNEQRDGNLLSWDENGSPSGPLGKRLKQILFRIRWVLVMICLALISGITYKIIKMSQTDLAATDVVPAPLRPLELTSADKFEITNRAAILEDINPVLVQFLGSKSPEEMKPLVREPERVIPLMDQFYKEQKPFTPATYRSLPKEENTRVEKHFIGVKMEDADFQSFVVTLEKTPKGYLVDWESFVNHGGMTVSQLRTTRPTTPVTMRCILSLDQYYNYDFSDEKLYQSYKIKFKDSEETLSGYVPRLSPVHEKIMSSQLSETTLHCVIKLKFPENSANDRQVEITEFLQSGWVFREMPEPKLK